MGHKAQAEAVFGIKGADRKRRIISALVASTMIGGANFVAPTIVHAQQQPQTPAIAFDIAAQPLGAAVNRFIRVTGWEVGFNSPTVVGKRSTAVKGTMTPEQALRTLLAGTGLVVQMSGASTAALVATSDDYANLGTITVQGNGAVTEGSGSYTTPEMSTAMKMPMSIRETPQSVSVVTRRMMQDKDYQTLDQAMADTPGITTKTGASSVRYEYWARGLEIDNIQYDGVSNNVHYFARDSDAADDLDMYDRVEVIKGAAGLTTGAGNPSGAINLVRKRPLDTDGGSVMVRASSWGNGRAVVDYSKSLNEDKTVRGRVVAAFGAGDGYRDYNSNRDGLFYGTVGVDLTPDTTVNVGYSYQKQKISGFDWGGLPAHTDGSFYDFSPSTFLGHEWDYLHRRQNALFLDLEHRFANGWKLNASGRAAWSRAEMRGAYTWWIGDNLWLYPGRYPYANDVYSFDVNASGPIEFFGRQHDFVVGANASRTNMWVGSSNYAASIIDPTDWDPAATPAPADVALSSASNERTDQVGVYASARFNLADNFKLVTGARMSWWKWNQEVTSYTTGATTPSSYSANGNLVPYVGLVYDLTPDLTAYASYTGIFKPQNNYDRNGDLLDPIKGTNLEAGLKADFFDARLSASAAVFRTRRDNVGQRIVGISYCNPLSSGCYEGVDGVETKGIEFEVRGAITERWNIVAGYTYANSKYTEGSLSGQRFNTTQAPENVFKLYTSYSFMDDKLTIGGGVRAQSKIYSRTATVNLKQGGFAVADVMAKYDIDDRISVQVNVNNLFDRRYYTSIDPTVGLNNWMGAPREVRISLRRAF